MDGGLTWKFQTKHIKSKLSRSYGLLAKLRYCVKPDLLRTVYFAIFDSILRYSLQVWGQNKNATFKEIEKLQNKAVRIMCFKSKLEPTKRIYKDLKIIKIRDLLTLINCQLVQAHMTGNLPQNFSDDFKEMRNQHNYKTKYFLVIYIGSYAYVFMYIYVACMSNISCGVSGCRNSRKNGFFCLPSIVTTDKRSEELSRNR